MQKIIQKKLYVFKKLQALSSKLQANFSRGFTIIEVMIAMAIFTVIVTIGIGSVMNAITEHNTTSNTRTVMDNLNFIMEDMARNIRLGQNIHCVSDISETVFVSPGDPASPVIPRSCPDGSSEIVFSDLNNRHLEYLISRPDAPVPNQIMKSLNDAPAQFITPPEVTMDFAHSGFTVRGAEPSTASPSDFSQPTVVIRLAGTINYQGYSSKFAIQTTVTLRALDS